MTEKLNNTSPEVKSAADMQEGESSTITSVGDGSTEIDCHCLRLMELGFTPGQEIKLVARSPFKEPIAFSVRGTVIALRSNEAQCIKIQ